MTTNPKIRLTPFQACGLGGTLLWGFYFVGYWRSQSFGLPTLWQDLLGDLLIFGLFVLPFTALFLLGLPRKAFAAGILIVLALTVIFVESFTCLQEMQVIREHGWNPGKEVFLQRWSPYGDHGIFYAPGYGWGGND